MLGWDGVGYDSEQVQTCSESDVLSKNGEIKHGEIQVGTVGEIQVGIVMIGPLWERHIRRGLWYRVGDTLSWRKWMWIVW